MFSFSGKRVLITGAGRGIGAAVARAFASHGARVLLNYRVDEESANRTLASLEGQGHALLKLDISKAENAKNLIEQGIEILGGLDILINNAGIGHYHPLLTTSYKDWQRAWQQTLNVNLLAPANICYHAAHHMKEQGGGRIVNISSRGAFRGEPDKPAYGASKAGLNALSQSLAVALAADNIFIGVVAPGFVDTDLAVAKLSGAEGDAIRAQSPLGRVARPEEVAHAVLFMASDGAQFSTGTIIDVNGASYLRS